MKNPFIIILIFFTLVLIYCVYKSSISNRKIAQPVRNLLFTAVLPLIGNLIIIASNTEVLSRWGYYFYFCGTNWMLVSLVRFTGDYCSLPYKKTVFRPIFITLAIIDSISQLLNEFFHHSFTVERLELTDTDIYYSLVSLSGHRIHLVFSYMLVAVAFGMLTYKVFSTPKIYFERYLLLLLSMVILMFWESYYIFSNTPVDMSMLGYAGCGILVYYFSLVYEPIFLLMRLRDIVVSNLDEAIFFFDTDYQCVYVNEEGRRRYHITDENMEDSGNVIQSLVQDPHMDLSRNFHLRKSIRANGKVEGYVIDYHRVMDEKEKIIGALFIIQDRTEEEEKIENERYQASHDSLTGIYNKERFITRARQILNANPNEEFIMISSDIKNFKLINDIFGAETGDDILVRIAKAIQRYASPDTIYGRISGDKFAVLMNKKNYDPDILLDGPKTVAHVDKDIHYPIVIHVGVFEVLDPTMSVSVMLDRTVMAISSIKDDYKKRLAIYDESMRKDMIWEQKVIGGIEEAIQNGEIRPYIQPIFRSDGKVLGGEIVTRWEHPVEGFLKPRRFLPLLEKNGMVSLLDHYIWRVACELIAEWEEIDKDIYVSVNVSPKDFFFMDIPQVFRELADSYDISHHRLHVEITEEAMMHDFERNLKVVEELRREGFVVVMDDFGSGYSSINVLNDVPIDLLKIDLKFLYNAKNKQKASVVLRTIMDLAKTLQIPTIMEGVETEDQVKETTEMGCDRFQGYYFARPMTIEAFQEKYGK